MKGFQIAVAVLLCGSVAFAHCGTCGDGAKKEGEKRACHTKMIDDRIATLDLSPKQADALKKATHKHHKTMKKAEKSYRKKVHKILGDDAKAEAFLKKPCKKCKGDKAKAKDCESCKVKPKK